MNHVFKIQRKRTLVGFAVVGGLLLSTLVCQAQTQPKPTRSPAASGYSVAWEKDLIYSDSLYVEKGGYQGLSGHTSGSGLQFAFAKNAKKNYPKKVNIVARAGMPDNMLEAGKLRMKVTFADGTTSEYKCDGSVFKRRDVKDSNGTVIGHYLYFTFSKSFNETKRISKIVAYSLNTDRTAVVHAKVSSFSY